ncbi:hypothetical protein Bbelb_322670 [Branchiostoma belcheri]|nr:hypothetical protein Bbelb_322670 [Branchiostoma belcheri]
MPIYRSMEAKLYSRAAFSVDDGVIFASYTRELRRGTYIMFGQEPFPCCDAGDMEKTNMVNSHILVCVMTSLLMTLLALPTVESAPAPYDAQDRLSEFRNLLKRLDDEDESYPLTDREDEYSNKMAPEEQELPFDAEGYGSEGKDEEMQKRGKKKKYRTICIDWTKGTWTWCWKAY